MTLTIEPETVTFADTVKDALRNPRLFQTLIVTPDGAAKVKAELLGIKAELNAQRIQRHTSLHDPAEYEAWVAKQAGFEKYVDRALAQVDVVLDSDVREQQIRNLRHVVDTLVAGIVAHQDDPHPDGPDDDALYGLLDQLTIHTGDRGNLTLRIAHATRPTLTEVAA